MSLKLVQNFPRIEFHKVGAYFYSWHPEFHLLPAHFRRRVLDYQKTEPEIIHYEHQPGEVTYDHFKQRVSPVSDNRVPLKFPEWSNKGLWGGEGVIYGFRKRKKHNPRLAKYWFPDLKQHALYSEILNEWYSVTVTDRTLFLIDKSCGFDHYILGTHERHLNSKLAMKFRKKLLIALATESIYPDDPKTKERVLRKYHKYIIPLEEAEWIGLTVYQAVVKMREIIAKEKESTTIPLKDLFIQEQIESSKEKKMDFKLKEGFMPSPFKSKKEAPA